ncbi:SRPBCC domain-containing protein [Emticicia agri]|uniref:SRPBCC domain-containing protein n=2 Tax=Emticicia agri TaxID=2492393 RepID=A0A4Q5LX91_9BACT|nr:SRPBCC domain-containing protein [Emticicia agri]
MKTIKKSIEIASTKEHVWEILIQDHHNRNWLAIFSPGSHALTDWQPGSKVVFSDDSGSGIIGRIIAHAPYELLEIEYYGMLNNHAEDFESEDAKLTNGARESYQLTSKDGQTLLAIECDMTEDSFDTMSELWEEALLKIKELAEEG